MSYTRRAFLLIITAMIILSTVSICAAQAGRARVEIEKIYQKITEAVQKKDFKFEGSFMAPDFVAIDKAGKTKNRDQAINEDTADGEIFKDVTKASSTIKSFELNKRGDQATVVVVQEFSGGLPGPDHIVHDYVSKAETRVTWVRAGARGWLMKKSEDIDVKVLVDGKPF